jgi:hypothetical protein
MNVMDELMDRMGLSASQASSLKLATDKKLKRNLKLTTVIADDVKREVRIEYC